MKKILLLICCAIIVSCEDNTQDLGMDVTKDLEIPQFSSMNEVTSTIKMLMSMSQTERIEWEKAHGYKSFHTKCEEVYNMVRAMKFETQEEVLNKVAEYSDYLQVLEDDGEIEVENVLYNSIYKYIIDENRFFRVENMFYKVFDQAIVGTNESNLLKLRELGGEEISSLSTDPAFDVIVSSNLSFKKDAANDVGRGETDRSDKQKVDGRYRRVKLEVDVSRLEAGGSTRIEYTRIITPQQRISWVWWRYEVDNVSADMDVRVDYELEPAGSPKEWDDEQVTEILSEDDSDRIYEYDIIYEIDAEESLDYHFGAYECYATTSHITNQAEVIENKYIL